MAALLLGYSTVIFLLGILTASGDEDSPCPDDAVSWEYIPATRKCIHRSEVNYGMTYEQARAVCHQRLHASLMIVEGDAEKDFLLKTISTCYSGDLCRSIEQYWLGIVWSDNSSMIAPGRAGWAWLDGSNYDYRKMTSAGMWAWPDMDKNCLRLHYTGYLATAECGAKLRFICQKDPVAEEKPLGRESSTVDTILTEEQTTISTSAVRMMTAHDDVIEAVVKPDTTSAGNVVSETASSPGDTETTLSSVVQTASLARSSPGRPVDREVISPRPRPPHLSPEVPKVVQTRPAQRVTSVSVSSTPARPPSATPSSSPSYSSSPSSTPSSTEAITSPSLSFPSSPHDQDSHSASVSFSSERQSSSSRSPSSGRTEIYSSTQSTTSPPTPLVPIYPSTSTVFPSTGHPTHPPPHHSSTATASSFTVSAASGAPGTNTSNSSSKTTSGRISTITRNTTVGGVHPFSSSTTHSPTSKPSSTTHKPSSATHKSSSTTHKPSSTTHKPSSATHKSSSTTHKPSSTTHKPSTSTRRRWNELLTTRRVSLLTPGLRTFPPRVVAGGQKGRLAFYVGVPLGCIVIILAGVVAILIISVRQRNQQKRSRYKRLIRLTPPPSLEDQQHRSFIHTNMWQEINMENPNLKLMAFLEAKVGNYDAMYVPHPLYPEHPRPGDYPEHQIVNHRYGLASHSLALSPAGMAGGSYDNPGRRDKRDKNRRSKHRSSEVDRNLLSTSTESIAGSELALSDLLADHSRSKPGGKGRGRKGKVRPASGASDTALLLADSARTSTTVENLHGVTNESCTDTDEIQGVTKDSSTDSDSRNTTLAVCSRPSSSTHLTATTNERSSAVLAKGVSSTVIEGDSGCSSTSMDAQHSQTLAPGDNAGNNRADIMNPHAALPDTHITVVQVDTTDDDNASMFNGFGKLTRLLTGTGKSTVYGASHPVMRSSDPGPGQSKNVAQKQETTHKKDDNSGPSSNASSSGKWRKSLMIY